VTARSKGVQDGVMNVSDAMPSQESADAFSRRVDNVALLVDGLAKGTLAPEYIDAKLERERHKLFSQEQRLTCTSTGDESSQDVRAPRSLSVDTMIACLLHDWLS
jgi:hypothetical protein